MLQFLDFMEFPKLGTCVALDCGTNSVDSSQEAVCGIVVFECFFPCGTTEHCY